jgi:hypothetical protein
MSHQTPPPANYPQNPNQPQYGGQPPFQSPPPGWQSPKPPKKPFFKRTWVIVTGAVLAVFIIIGIFSGGGNNTGSTGGGATETPATSAPATQPKTSAKPTTKPPATTQPPAGTTCTGNRNDPCVVKLGVAFTVGKHQMGKGWKLKTEEYVGTKLAGTVTNVADKASTAFFTVKFLKENQVVANFQCSSSELEPRQSEDIECYNMSDTTRTLKAGSYNKITAEADF